MQSHPTRILRLAQVRERTGLSTSSIYAKIADGSFPKQVSLGVHSVGWVEAEIDAYIDARVAERDAVALKNLKGKPTTDDGRGAVARELIRKVAREKTNW
jgi:prophage regulatory protein